MVEGVFSVTCCRQNKVVALFKFQFSSSSSSSEAPMPLCTHMQRTQVVLYSTYAHAIYAPTYNHRERRGKGVGTWEGALETHELQKGQETSRWRAEDCGKKRETSPPPSNSC